MARQITNYRTFIDNGGNEYEAYRDGNDGHVYVYPYGTLEDEMKKEYRYVDWNSYDGEINLRPRGEVKPVEKKKKRIKFKYVGVCKTFFLKCWKWLREESFTSRFIYTVVCWWRGLGDD